MGRTGPTQHTLNLIEEIQWLLEFRESPEHIARQVGVSLGGIYQTLRKWGYHDIACQFEAARQRKHSLV